MVAFYVIARPGSDKILLFRMRNIVDLAKIDYLARCQGAEDCRILLTSGTDSDRFLRPASERQIGSEEKVLIYLALSYQRYFFLPYSFISQV